MTSSSATVNLLDLAASCLSSAVVAADQITALCEPGLKENAKNVRLKNDGSFVTDADLAAQGIIVQSLRSISTDVRLVGEESEDEMAHQIITGHEERSESIFRLAQQEILIRYNNQNQSNDDPLPLAQTATSTSTDGDSPSSTTAFRNNGTMVELSKLEEYEVDPKRVSVFIDPLDGTKAYARGDYEPVSILVAIILDETPCFGVICKPFGCRGQTSILDTGCAAIYGGTLLGAAYTAGGSKCTWKPQEATDVLPRAVISSSRSEGIVQDFVTHLGSKGMIDPEPMMISGAGEKSLRIILRSENEGLWFFPKAGTSLWDVAASDALLRATGGRLTDKNGNDMDYSKSRNEAENEEGVVACYDHTLHAECIKLFLEGTWNESS
jgi:3'-phosphoadenosine 5'-phosphosulfate (PAPS) 3'-phosphatase